VEKYFSAGSFYGLKMNNEPAIQNADFLRKLISEIKDAYKDEDRLRMVTSDGSVPSQVTTVQLDRLGK